MSGGLLEKAKQASEDSDEDVGAAADAVIDSGPPKTSSSSKGNLFLYVAVGSLLVSMVLLYMLSSLPDFSGFAVLIIFIASFAAAWMHVKEDHNDGAKPTGIQVSALVVAYLLLGGLPYVGAMDFGGQTTLTDVTYDEASDTVLLEMRYTPGLFGDTFGSGEVDVEVLYGGDSVYSNKVTVTMSESPEGGEIGTFSLNVDDFYSGNANYVSGSTSNTPQLSENKYEVIASIAGSESISAYLPALNLTRTVNDADVFVDPYEDGDNCPSGKDSCIQRLYMTGWIGISDPAYDSSSVPGAVRGDYTVDIDFTFVDGNELMVDYPTIQSRAHMLLGIRLVMVQASQRLGNSVHHSPLREKCRTMLTGGISTVIPHSMTMAAIVWISWSVNPVLMLQVERDTPCHRLTSCLKSTTNPVIHPMAKIPTGNRLNRYLLAD